MGDSTVIAARLRTLVEQEGSLEAACRKAGLPPHTAARILAGVGVRRGSLLTAELALNALGVPAPMSIDTSPKVNL
jgi:hypothetical protein